MPAPNRYLDELISCGGEAQTRAEIIAEMQAEGTPQPLIDRWLQGQELAAKLRARRAGLSARVFLSFKESSNHPNT